MIDKRLVVRLPVRGSFGPAGFMVRVNPNSFHSKCMGGLQISGDIIEHGPRFGLEVGALDEFLKCRHLVVRHIIGGRNVVNFVKVMPNIQCRSDTLRMS